MMAYFKYWISCGNWFHEYTQVFIIETTVCWHTRIQKADPTLVKIVEIFFFLRLFLRGD